MTFFYPLLSVSAFHKLAFLKPNLHHPPGVCLDQAFVCTNMYMWSQEYRLLPKLLLVHAKESTFDFNLCLYWSFLHEVLSEMQTHHQNG